MTMSAVPMKKKIPSARRGTWKYVVAGVLAMAILGIAVGCFFVLREDPDVVHVKELGQRLFTSGSDLSEEDRSRLWGELRQAQERLTPGQRQQLNRDVASVFRNRMMQQIDGYFALPEEERNAYLDREIERMEQQRREFERRFAASGSSGRGGSPGGGPPSGGPPGGFGGPPRGRGDRGDDELSRRRRMLDNTTPEERAKFTAYMDAMNDRREQLGLPPMGPPRRGGGRRP